MAILEDDWRKLTVDS
ncbi:Putative uncharacterized protein [Lactobacillus delbrueckii subsp. lactis]|nr:Putative uncharacterized protein [Lactobacillus delbrueckii subsp. lactis]